MSLARASDLADAGLLSYWLPTSAAAQLLRYINDKIAPAAIEQTVHSNAERFLGLIPGPLS